MLIVNRAEVLTLFSELGIMFDQTWSDKKLVENYISKLNNLITDDDHPQTRASKELFDEIIIELQGDKDFRLAEDVADKPKAKKGKSKKAKPAKAAGKAPAKATPASNGLDAFGFRLGSHNNKTACKILTDKPLSVQALLKAGAPYANEGACRNNLLKMVERGFVIRDAKDNHVTYRLSAKGKETRAKQAKVKK
jgi:hypothetical protein